jgi:hypothetical protein
MAYTIEDIDKITEYKTWNDKKKIDTLLEIDCEMYTNLGIESPKSLRELTKKNSRKIYRCIKKINPTLGSSLLHAHDSE